MVDLGAADPAALRSPTGGWTLDPVDGTKGFLRGEQYCVSLAMIRGGQVMHGLLGCPHLAHAPLDQTTADSPRGCLFIASLGQGPMMRLLGDETHASGPIARHDLGPTEAAQLSESVETSHTRQDVAARIMQLAGPVGPPVQMDSQCKYALLARADADVYLRLPSKRGYVERIWDHAAGMLIAEEAGCVVTDIRGRPLDFSRGRGLEKNEGIIGAPPSLHARLLHAIARILPPTTEP